MKKSFSILLIATLIFSIMMSTCGCQKDSCSSISSIDSSVKAYKDYGPNFRADLMKADQSNLPGAMYIAYEGQRWNGVDYKIGMQLLANMGVKCIRNGMFADQLYPTNDTQNDEEIQVMHNIIAEAHKYGIMVIATVSGNINDTGFNNSLPRRDMTEDSNYLEWLKVLQNLYYRIVKEFPEITYWEIENEPNEGGVYIDGGSYNVKDKSKIYTDMMFYASRGIHEANSNSVSMLGGLGEFSGLSAMMSKSFLGMIYDNIYSGEWPSMYPDDYFQTVAWHPYTFHNFDRKKFVECNNEIYNVIKTREGKDKKVFFTEFGFSDGMASQDDIAKWLPEVLKTIKEELPYVESLCYFRAFNDLNDLNWGGEMSLTMYGLFYDPNPNHEDVLDGVRQIPGAPKPVAYSFQKAAGGSGDLTLFVPESFRSQLNSN